MTVWAGVCEETTIGGFFFEGAAEVAVTVNGERYWVVITDFFIYFLTDMSWI